MRLIIQHLVGLYQDYLENKIIHLQERGCMIHLKYAWFGKK